MTHENMQKNKYRAVHLKSLLLSNGWHVYEEYIKEFVYEHVGSSLNKDVLAGLKMALDEPKKLVQQYEEKEKGL